MEALNTSVLKIYTSTTDKISGKIAYEYILTKARKETIAGATVFRGIMGYGMSSKISSSKFWELTEKLPIVVELIDYTAKLEKFYEVIENDLLSMKKGCMVIMEPIKIKLHKKGNK